MVPTAGWKTVPAYSIASEEPDYYLSMGLTAEAVAKEYGVSGKTAQDEFSLKSHQKALNAIKNGYFKSGILPVQVDEVFVDTKGKRQTRNFVVDTDEGPRADTSLAALAKLKPVFAAGGALLPAIHPRPVTALPL